MNTIDDSSAKLMDLINAAMHRKQWTVIRAAEEATKLNMDYLGTSTINHYRSAQARKPRERKVRDFARLFGEDPERWLVACGFVNPFDRLVYSSNDVLNMQRGLGLGDEVWVIGCRAFGEAEKPAIQDMVMKNLDQGVTYCYFFPPGTEKGRAKHPYGTKAAESYRLLRKTQILQYPFSRSPLIAGFAVDTSSFAYFSKLHTILCFWYASREEAIPLLGVGAAFNRNSANLQDRQWHKIPKEDFQKLVARLKDARDAAADEGLRTLRINPRLTQLNRTYTKYFEREESVVTGDRLAKILKPADKSIEYILTAIGKADPAVGSEEAIRFLDIGCGSGRVTREIAERLKARSANKYKLIALDASKVRLDLARAELERSSQLTSDPSKFDIQFINQTFQDAELPERGFEIITAIHSAYVMDDGLLGRIFDLLAPGGIACLWMHGRTGNVIAKMAEAVDAVLHPQQGRNFAEDVIRTFRLIGLGEKSRFRTEPVVGYIPVLLTPDGNLTDEGRDFVAFLSCEQEDESLAALRAATEAASESLRDSPAIRDHMLTDYLISFQRI